MPHVQKEWRTLPSTIFQWTSALFQVMGFKMDSWRCGLPATFLEGAKKITHLTHGSFSITNSVYCLGCVFLGHFSPLFRCLPCFCETILSGRTLLQTLVRSSFWPKAVTNKLPVPRAAPRSFETAPSQKVYSKVAFGFFSQYGLYGLDPCI